MAATVPREHPGRLGEALNAITPALIFGFVRAASAGRASLTYVNARGNGEFVALENEAPPALRPSADDARQAEVANLPAASGAPEWTLLLDGVRRIASARVGDGQATRLWVGLADPRPLTSEQLARLQDVATGSAGAANAAMSAEELRARAT